MPEAEKEDELIFVGVDIETSGLEYKDGARLIQIGVCTDDQEFCSLVKPADALSITMVWDNEAAAVHNIPVDDVLAAPAEGEVDIDLYQWLLKIGAQVEKRLLVAVGWNVGSFDMPFIKAQLPLTHSLFSRRTADLNAVCFAMGESTGVGSWARWKESAKGWAADQQGEERYHDALFDAKNALLSWHYLTQSITGRC